MARVLVSIPNVVTLSRQFVVTSAAVTVAVIAIARPLVMSESHSTLHERTKRSLFPRVNKSHVDEFTTSTRLFKDKLKLNH